MNAVHKRLLAAGLVLCCSVAQADPLPAYPFVTAHGKAELWLAPDIGEIRFELNVQSNSAQEANERMEQRAGAVLALLAEHTLASADVESFDVSKKPVELSNPRDIQHKSAFLLSRHFHVQVRDLRLWPELLASLMAREEVETLSVGFDRTDRDSIERKLIVEASTSARADGAVLAQAFGRQAGPAMAISRAGLDRAGAPFGFGEPAPALQPARLAAPNATSYSVPPAILFTQSVNAVIKLK